MLRVVVTAAVLTLVLRAIEWPAMAELAENLHWPMFLLAAGGMGLAYPLHAVRLGLLLRPQGIRLPFHELHRITWISVFFGAFTPGAVGGDVSRLLHMYGRDPDNKPGATAAVLADRVIGLAVLLLLATFTTTYYLWTTKSAAGEITTLFPVLLLALITVAAGWVVLSRLPAGGRFAEARAAARRTVRPGTPLLLAVLVSLAIWSADFAAGWLLARSLGWPVGPVEISIALAVAYTVASLPVSLGGHGVREGTMVVVLGWFGYSAGAPTLAFAVLSLTLFYGLIGGAVWLLAPSPAR